MIGKLLVGSDWVFIEHSLSLKRPQEKLAFVGLGPSLWDCWVDAEHVSGLQAPGEQNCMCSA